VVLHYDFDMSDAEQRAELIHRNKQREKTVEVRAREYKKLAEANAVIAQERMMAGVKANPLENFTEGSICSKDEAAKAVGMSRPTAEKAAAVVHKIDELEASGEKAKAADLKKTLNNKSVSAAYAKATGKAKPAKLKTIKPKKAKLKVVRPNKKLDFDDAVVDGYFGFLFRAIDERAKILNGKNHVEYKACCKALHEFADHWKAWKKGRT
jgi:hypothetical protein